MERRNHLLKELCLCLDLGEKPVRFVLAWLVKLLKRYCLNLLSRIVKGRQNELAYENFASHIKQIIIKSKLFSDSFLKFGKEISAESIPFQINFCQTVNLWRT